MDLQLFNDDFDYDDNIDIDTNDNEDTAESVAEEKGDSGDDLEIPEEFAGLSPDIAKEFTLKWKKQQQQQEKTENAEQGQTEPEEKEDKSPDDKTEQASKSLEDRIKELEEENARLKSAQQQPISKPKKAADVPPALKPLQIEQFPIEVVHKIRQRAKEIALKTVGITAQQLDDLEFEDGGAEKKADYETAYTIAQNNLVSGINNELAARAQREHAFLQAHEANMKAFKAYEAEQMKSPDFEAVKNFAINDFFEKQPEMDQMMIRDAYARLERGVGSPVDSYAIKKYFEEAKTAYNAIVKVKDNKQAKAVEKYKQAAKLPRSDKLAGSSSGNNETSIDTAIRLMKTKKWEEIPEKYQNILKGL